MLALLLALAAPATAEPPPAPPSAPPPAPAPPDTTEFVPGLFRSYSAVPGLVTAGQPQESLFVRLQESGYRTIVDLRPPGELRGLDEPRAARAARLRYVNVPITGATLGDRDFARVRKLLRDPKRRPLVIHCATGNRVGATLIPFLILDQGRTPEEAMAIAERGGLRSEPMRQKALDYVRREAAKRDR